MKQLCLISPAFAFPVGERGFYFPHKELCISLRKRGVKPTIVCLGPNMRYEDEFVAVHSVPMPPNPPAMLASWMPSNSYYMAVATALWQKYLSLAAEQKFDIIDIPAYLPFDSKTLPPETAVVVRTYTESGSPSKRAGMGPVDSMMQDNVQAIALLQADAVLVDEVADACTNRWARKLRNAFTARLMSELESAVLDSEKPILPRNDLKTIMLGSSAADVEWSVTCCKAIKEYLQERDDVRFIVPIFQRELSSGELQLITELKQSLRLRGKLDRFYLIRPLAINKLGGCVRSADAVIAPLRDSGLPSIGLEALHAGKPVVVQSQNPLARFVVINDCGVVVSDGQDLPAIKEAFDRVLKDPQKLGESASTATTKLFDEYVNGVLKCYATALDFQSADAAESAKTTKPPSALQAEVTSTPSQPEFLVACDRLLYDIHYKTSLRFRVKHWLNRLSQTKRHPSKKI